MGTMIAHPRPTVTERPQALSPIRGPDSRAFGPANGPTCVAKSLDRQFGCEQRIPHDLALAANSSTHGSGGTRILSVIDTLEFLLGLWKIDRSIRDHRAAVDGSFIGIASIQAASEIQSGLLARYSETGELHFGGHQGAANRTLNYAPARQAAVMLLFRDLRPFVDLDLSSGTWRSDHRCGGDRYEIVTTVGSDESFEESWRVRGPAKSYDTFTRFTRRP